LSDPVSMLKTFGTIAKKLNQRIQECKAADNLGVLAKIPGARLHQLSGNRKNQLSVTVSGNVRIVFEPWHDPIPQKLDGGLHYEAVAEIRIIEITDYH